VTVDNLGAEAVGGRVELTAPAGWNPTAQGQPTFAGLAPGGRAELTFQVKVPLDAPLDPFAVEHGLTATVTFTGGRSGQLQATATPVVAPALAAELVYQAKLLNPQQEMAPAIMRWGWEREVKIPPPPPVAVQAETPLRVTIVAEPGLAGKTIRLTLQPEGQVSPAEVRLTSTRQVVDAVVTMQQVGPYTLVLEAGQVRAEERFAAGLNDETVAARLAKAQPAPVTWRTLGQLCLGARGAAARLTPVTVPLSLPERELEWAQVLDEQGDPVRRRS